MSINGKINDEKINNSPTIILEEELEKKLFNWKNKISASSIIGGAEL